MFSQYCLSRITELSIEYEQIVCKKTGFEIYLMYCAADALFHVSHQGTKPANENSVISFTMIYLTLTSQPVVYESPFFTRLLTSLISHSYHA